MGARLQRKRSEVQTTRLGVINSITLFGDLILTRNVLKPHLREQVSVYLRSSGLFVRELVKTNQPIRQGEHRSSLKQVVYISILFSRKKRLANV